MHTSTSSPLVAAARALVDAYMHQAESEPGAKDDRPDSGFREMMRDLIEVVSDDFDNCNEPAIGALTQALHEAAADLRIGG